jgi:hypothetical protein
VLVFQAKINQIQVPRPIMYIHLNVEETDQVLNTQIPLLTCIYIPTSEASKFQIRSVKFFDDVYKPIFLALDELLSDSPDFKVLFFEEIERIFFFLLERKYLPYRLLVESDPIL